MTNPVVYSETLRVQEWLRIRGNWVVICTSESLTTRWMVTTRKSWYFGLRRGLTINIGNQQVFAVYRESLLGRLVEKELL